MRTQPEVSERYWRALLASLATLAAVAIAALATASTSHAGLEGDLSCSFDVATHNLTVTFNYDHVAGRIVRDGDDLVVDAIAPPLDCGGTQDPTRSNTDLVRVRSQASADDLRFYLRLSGGPFAPGFSNEGDGSSEIEFLVTFPAGVGRMSITAHNGPDGIVLGRLADGQGANLNSAEDVDDADVTIRRRIFLVVHGYRGADVVSAHGGGGFIGPYPRSVFVFGDRGPDVLTGGRKADHLGGGRGHDTMKGGSGGDFLSARDHTRDVVRCGSGSDVAEVDRSDQVRRCEDVRTKGRSL